MVMVIKTAGKHKLLPSEGNTESGIRPTSYVLSCKVFDSKYKLNKHTLQVPSSTIQNILYADEGKKLLITNQLQTFVIVYCGCCDEPNYLSCFIITLSMKDSGFSGNDSMNIRWVTH
ncbi:MAG: hypothetical protein EZS28_021808 [Streblomastix strix]|uniref:Uncharacterized protein n=1 Tax=Streblomastix strix TaxID=222440 RepID=A0A5J4VKC9_9EUKA|nr:MAG: hypothetical protein EZS28_021808 [Streblomastix strix]